MADLAIKRREREIYQNMVLNLLRYHQQREREIAKLEKKARRKIVKSNKKLLLNEKQKD